MSGRSRLADDRCLSPQDRSGMVRQLLGAHRWSQRRALLAASLATVALSACSMMRQDQQRSAPELAEQAEQEPLVWSASVPRRRASLRSLPRGGDDSIEHVSGLELSSELSAVYGPLTLEGGRWLASLDASGELRAELLQVEPASSRMLSRERAERPIWVDAERAAVELWWLLYSEPPDVSGAWIELIIEALVPPSQASRPVWEAPAATADRGDPSATIARSALLDEAGLYGGARLSGGALELELGGRAGGTVDAAELGQGCVGWVSRVPNHLLVVEARQRLSVRVRASSGDDLTLMLVGPDGERFCKDDDHGLDPSFEGTLSAGTWSLHVGSWVPESDPRYSLELKGR